MIQATRELEQSYLNFAQQLIEVLGRKIAAYELQSGLVQQHRRLSEVAEAMWNAADPRPQEQQYLAIISEIQETLNKKQAVYALAADCGRIHGHLVQLGSELGWANPQAFENQSHPQADGYSEGGPVPPERLSKLQQQIEELRTALA